MHAVWINLWRILWHCALWSVLSIGGNTVALSDIFRYAVDVRHWLTSTQFVAFFAISQALPGPNGMALVLIGQQAAGIPGALVALVAKLVPSSLIAYTGASWYEGNKDRDWVKTAKLGLVPVTVGLLLAATFVLTYAVDVKVSRILLTIVAAAVVYQTRWNPIWLIFGSLALGVTSAVTGANLF
jgi:chromate transporter